MGWVGTVLLIYSWWGIGYKWSHAILVGVLGSLLWAIVAYNKEMWDLFTVEVVLGSIQLRGWYKWRNG